MRRHTAILASFSALLLAGCGSGTSTSAPEGKPAAAVAPAPPLVTLPQGAILPLVLATSVSSGTSRSGDLVLAKLSEDVKVGERVVVPAGSEVRGLVTAAVPSGRVKGSARLAFDFDTLVLAGREYAIGTRAIDITAPDSHKRDAATIGIGVGAGAIVGAILDGKKGLGVGALVGGAAGTGVVLTSHGKEVELGSGTRVTVRLTRDARF